MTHTVNTQDIIKATDTLYRVARTADKHGSAWLFDKLMRYFTAEPAAMSVNIPIIYNTGKTGVAEIDRRGTLTTR